MLRVCLYCARDPSEPFKVAPLGIGYIGSYLISQGLVREADIRIVDCLEEAIDFRPDILGVSAVSQVAGDARHFARKCKEFTGCLTVLGGYHVTCIPNQLPEEFDIGVMSEGELTFSEIMDKHMKGRLDKSTLSGIRGICHRQDGRVVQTQPRELIEDIDSLPWPLRHNSYSNDEPIFTSRGCPFRCRFCASNTFWRAHTRFRSANSVVDEITNIVDTYQPKEIAILDDLWIADKKRFRNIVSSLASRGIPQKVTFRGFCRSDIVDEETILLFKKLNYSIVRFGAETGSERLLKRIKGKGISISDHQRVIDLCFKHGLKCGASFMFGIPGETLQDLRLTVEFLRRNKGKCHIVGFYLFNPIPGTALWNELLDMGEVSENLNLEQLQLDLLNSNFSWNEVLYFNEKNISLTRFREFIESVKSEFIDPTESEETALGFVHASRGLLEKVLCFFRN